MSDKKFIPVIGRTTPDCYLHGIGTEDDIGCIGQIEYVGTDYFVLRNKYTDKPMLVVESEYWCIEEGDFY